MSTPKEVLDQAALFLRITFIGMIFLTIYNFEAAILRPVEIQNDHYTAY